MKICFHTNFEISKKYIGGTERFLIKLSKELQAFGHDPFIVCTSPIEESNVEGIKVLGRIPKLFRDQFEKYSYFSSAFIKNEIIGDKFSAESLKRLSLYTEGQLEGINADVFHLNSFASASFLLPKGIYFVTNHENEYEYDSYWGKGFFKMLETLAKEKQCELHKYKGLITPSVYYAKEYSNRFNIRIQGINLGIHLYDFPISTARHSLRDEYFGEDKGTIILLPSRFQIKQKGHDIAIKASSILKKKGFRFKIIFTGLKKSCEKYLPEFYEWVNEYGLEEEVRVTSFSNIQTAYDNCDIVISPEKYCSYGLSISESLALGIPTVLSDIPTYKEIANEYEHAFFFKNGEPEDLAEKLIDIIKSGPKRNIVEATSFRFKYDLRECARKYALLYMNEFYTS